MARRGRLATTLGLLLLLLVDVALVVAALRISTRSRAAEPVGVETGSPGAVESAGPGPAGTTSPTDSPTSTDAPLAAPAVPLQVLLSAVDRSVAWRARAGACGSGGAGVSLTTDGGSTWRTRTSPYPVLSRLQPTDAAKAFVVGTTPACDVGIKTTTDGGATWPGTGAIADTLARDPKDATKVRAPGNQTIAPCDGNPVVDLARSSASAAQALCADGSLRGTADDGRTWTKVADQAGAVALDSRGNGTGVATYLAVLKAGCQGVAVVSVSGGTATDLACVVTSVPAPGNVAISVPTPDAGWLLVGDVTWRSSDGLKSWARAGG